MSLYDNLIGTLASTFNIGGPSGVSYPSTSVTKGQLFVGTASNTYGPVTGSGDLTWSSSTAGSATVSKINGATVPAAGSLTTGNVLQVNGTSSTTYAALNLAGGSNYVTGQLPVANLANGSAAQILVTNSGATAPAWVSMSGDITITAAGATTLGSIDGIALPAPTGTNTVLTYSGSALSWSAGGGGGSVTWANDLAGSTSTNQYVVGISGSGGTAGTITLGDGTHNLSLTQVTSVQTTAPTLSITSSQGYSVAATAGAAGGLLSIKGGAGGAGQGTNHTGGAGAGVTIVTGAGGAATGTAANANGGALTINTGAAGTGGSGTAGSPGQINFQIGGTGVLDITSSTQISPHADNSLTIGTASLRLANVIFANANGYAASGDANASILFQPAGSGTSESNMLGGAIWLGVGATLPVDVTLCHTTNSSELAIQDEFQNTVVIFTSGGTNYFTVVSNTMYWNNGQNATLNTNCSWTYPAQASTSSASGQVGGSVTFSTQPGQPATGTSHTGGAGGAIVLQASNGGTSGSSTGGAGGACTVEAGAGANTSSTSANGGAGGLLTLKGQAGGNGGSSSGTGGAGGGVTIATGAGGTGHTAGANGTLTVSIAGTSVLTWQTTPNWQVSAITLTATGTTTLTAAQYLLHIISINSVTTTGNTTLAFPNVAGFWILDVSQLTLGATFTFSVSSGTATSATTASLLSTSQLWLVRTTGSNGISVST